MSDPYHNYIISIISILGFRLAPPVVGRRINLTELLPVTSKSLLKTYVKKGIYVCNYVYMYIWLCVHMYVHVYVIIMY